MRKFILTIIYFALPLIIVLTPGIFILLSTRESFFNIDKAIYNFDRQRYLIGYLYNESNYRYIKYKTLAERKATVVALGSSRVLPFRKEMFNSSFYNAGFTVDNIQGFQAFLTSLPDKSLPDYLILGLDQWMFNDAWIEITSIPSSSHWKKNLSYDVGKGIRKIKDTYIDIFRGELNSIDKSQKISPAIQLIGLNAHLHSTGFRNDGSSYYGELMQKLIDHDSTIIDYNFKDSFARITNGNRRLQYGREVSAKSIEILTELLSFCESKGIHVVGFLPPFADAVYLKMKSSGKYDYIEKLFPALRRVFKKYDFEIFCYNQASACGSNDTEAIDGLHGGEKTYLRMVIDMLRNNSTLNNVCNLKELEGDLSKSESNYVVYPY